MGEVLLRAHLDAVGVRARVSSAGTMSWGGHATDHAIAVMHELGIDLRDHESRQLTAEMVESADLVLGMTRDHVERVAALVPDAIDRTFLASELIRLSGGVEARSEEEAVRSWAARAARTRPRAFAVGRPDDEVADPVGEPLTVYRTTAARLDRDLRSLAGLLVPSA
jgi:protein-tyrosine phosphatase